MKNLELLNNFMIEAIETYEDILKDNMKIIETSLGGQLEIKQYSDGSGVVGFVGDTDIFSFKGNDDLSIKLRKFANMIK